MHRGWILCALGLTVVLGTARLFQLERRFAELERRPVATPTEVVGLRSELAEQAARVAREQAGQVEQDRELSLSLQNLAAAFRQSSARVQENRTLLEAIEAEREEFQQVSVIEARIATLDRALEDRWSFVNNLAESTAGLARSNESLLKDLHSELQRDYEAMWNDLVGPVVQLAGDTTVGSGILLESRPVKGEEGVWETHLLTSWHVVRDIQSTLENIEMPVPVAVYSYDGPVRHMTARVLEFDPSIDSALLKLDARERMTCGARLATHEQLASTRIFEPVYAVGCPLGNDPIPTYGEVAATQHVVDGDRYWMISAPTYVGNSGGGIFDARSRVLLGVFSKIYTHGTLRPTVVPHMGLVTPLDVIYTWLERVGYADLIPEESREAVDPVQVAEARHAETTPADTEPDEQR